MTTSKTDTDIQAYKILLSQDIWHMMQEFSKSNYNLQFLKSNLEFFTGVVDDLIADEAKAVQ